MKSIFLGLWCLLFVSTAAHAADSGSGIMACIGSDGQIKNADPTKVCKAILPKCADLRADLIAKTKDLLEWKLYGYYYLNRDLDMTKSSKSNLVGPNLPQPICSVVGNKLQQTGRPSDLEIETQQIGPAHRSCGNPPTFTNQKYKYSTKITYTGDGGTNWSSYVLGARIWEIRKAAYEVFAELKSKDDLSNFDQVVTDAMTNKSFKDSYTEMNKAFTDLSISSKATCNNSAPTENVANSCIAGSYQLNDPLQMLCTLAKAQLAFHGVSASNGLVIEIMKRADKMHEQYFQTIFDATANTDFKNLIEHCSKRAVDAKVKATVGAILIAATGGAAAPFVATAAAASKIALARLHYSCNASCLDGGYRYYTGDKSDNEWPSWRTDEAGQKQRKCKMEVPYNLELRKYQNKLASMFLEKFSWSTPKSIVDGIVKEWNQHQSDENDVTVQNPLSEPTFNFGFPAMVEKIIRQDICKQGDRKRYSSDCDLVDLQIKDKSKS